MQITALYNRVTAVGRYLISRGMLLVWLSPNMTKLRLFAGLGTPLKMSISASTPESLEHSWMLLVCHMTLLLPTWCCAASGEREIGEDGGVRGHWGFLEI